MGALSLPELLWSWTRALPGFVGFVVFLGGEGVGGCPLFGLWVRRSSIDSSNILACGAASLHSTLLRHNWEKNAAEWSQCVCVCACVWLLTPPPRPSKTLAVRGLVGPAGRAGGGQPPLASLPSHSSRRWGPKASRRAVPSLGADWTSRPQGRGGTGRLIGGSQWALDIGPIFPSLFLPLVVRAGGV